MHDLKEKCYVCVREANEMYKKMQPLENKIVTGQAYSPDLPAKLRAAEKHK